MLDSIATEFVCTVPLDARGARFPQCATPGEIGVCTEVRIGFLAAIAVLPGGHF